MLKISNLFNLIATDLHYHYNYKKLVSLRETTIQIVGNELSKMHLKKYGK